MWTWAPVPGAEGGGFGNEGGAEGVVGGAEGDYFAGGEEGVYCDEGGRGGRTNSYWPGLLSE